MSPELIVALGVGGSLVLLALMILGYKQTQRAERRAVDAARRLLPKYTRELLGHRFVGPVHGVELTLRLVNRQSKTTSVEQQWGAGLWTFLQLPPLPPGLLLELRQQNPTETHLVGRGRARDVVVGDAAFDAAFIVEMAPASAAPALFDADLRRRLLELRPVFIVPTEKGGVQLEKSGWDEDRFAALIEAGALLATRLRQVAGAEAAQAERWGSSHATERAAEQAELGKVRVTRASRDVWKILLVVGVFLVILVLRLLLS